MSKGATEERRRIGAAGPARGEAGKVVELRDFSISLPGRRIIREACLSLEAGSSVALVGPTGVGKSLLLRSIAGLLPPAVFETAGELEVFGRRCWTEAGKAPFATWAELRKEGLVFVPPEPALVLNHALTLAQNLGIFSDEGAGLVEERLGRYFGIRWASYAKRYPDEVSGGELQRISLMILLARRARLILLDEPTVSLDADLRVSFLDFLNHEILTGAPGASLEAAEGLPSPTLLLASHDLDFVQRVSIHRCLRLEGGLLAAGETEREGVEGPTKKRGGKEGLEFEARGLSQSYLQRGVFGVARTPAFGSMSARFGPSLVHGIRGRSGCGKTSFFKAALRLLSDTEGEALFDGSGLVALKPDERGSDDAGFRPWRRRMGIVQQDSRFAFLPDRPVLDSLKLVFAKAGIEAARGEARARELLPLLGLGAGYLEAMPLSLSSGEAKRLDLLRVLCCDLDLLFLDEPFAHIDYATRLQVMRAVGAWLDERERVLVAATHEDFDLRHFTDRVWDFPSLARTAREAESPALE